MFPHGDSIQLLVVHTEQMIPPSSILSHHVPHLSLGNRGTISSLSDRRTGGLYLKLQQVGGWQTWGKGAKHPRVLADKVIYLELS